MKKIKFNRFNIIIFSVTLVLLIFFVSAYFNSFSDYVKKDKSKIEGDTVYINDLANDYYYYLGMNYVGDIYSNEVNYKETDLKMVTVNYYAYPSNDSSLTGYVSLNEKQNKFVYYKYFPVKNNQIEIELIDNPFVLRPNNKGFGGWQSQDGVITKDSKTNTYKLTISSSLNEVNIYTNWANANVVYLKGEEGDDNFNGSTDYDAVASFGRAFEILRNNSTNLNDRELNIIVLTGNIDHTINYSRSVTHNWDYTYTYQDNESFNEGEEYLIEYKDGNNRYALNDNWSNVDREILSENVKPSDKSLWIITHNENGYLIKNKDSGNYLGYTQYYNDQVAIFVRSDPYYWQYESNIRTFFTKFNLTITKYRYTLNSMVNSNNTYLIADKNSYTNENNFESLNILNNNLTNTSIDTENYNENNLWRITSSGSGYTILNNNSNRYLNYESLNGNTNLVLSNNSLIWNYDNSLNNLYTNVTHYLTSYNYSTSAISTGSFYIGYQNGDSYYLLNNDMEFVEYDSTSEPDSSMMWDLIQTGGNYYLQNSDGQYIRSNRGNLSLSTYNRTAFTLNNNRLYVYQNGNYRYLYNNNGTLATTTNQNTGTMLYHVNVQETTTITGQENMYLNFNNNTWNLSLTGNPISFVSYEKETVNEEKNFYLRYDTTNNNFTFDMNKQGTNLYFATYTESREMLNTNRGNIANNNYYNNNTNIAVTITSMYDNIDYRNNATIDLTDDYYRTIAYNDLQLEYLKINADGYSAIGDNNTTTDLRNSYASLIGNNNNVRIGRGMTPSSWTDTSSTIFSFLQGGGDSSVGSQTNTNNAYKLVVESGRYSGLMASKINNNYYGNNYYNYYGSIYLTLGSDYDRAINNNDLLDIYYRLGSSNYNGINGTGNIHDLAYLINVKSGSIGMYYFNNNQDASRAYSGIYVGGLTVNANTQNDDISSRVLIVEGGNIANINGGLRITENSGNSSVNTKIYVKNGTIQNIVGGAGVSTTYGDRFISVTGGNVAYSISGGSNGVAATDESGQSGRLGGDSYVHVGGEAHIGTSGSGLLYDVSYGSVLGAGNGNEDFQTSGRVNTSHVYVSGDAVIEGNVYGGGNFGPVLVDSNIQIDGGEVKGNIYGGANKNGVGTVAINESTIYNVTFDDDKELTSGETYIINKNVNNTRNLLSENNSEGTYNVSLSQGNQPSNYSRWIITGNNNEYTIKNLNYNYYLAYTTDNNPTLTINRNNENSTWNYDNTNKTFYRDITYTSSVTINYNYTTNITSGSEYVITNTNTNSAYSLNSDIGRSQLSTSSEPTDNVWIFRSSGNGYTIQNKDTLEYLSLGNGWGASLTTSNTPTVWSWDANNNRLSSEFDTWWGGSTTYYLRYNNGFTISTNTYSVYLASYNVVRETETKRFYLVFDNTWKLSTVPSSIMLSTYSSTSITGYSVSNKSDGNVTISVNNGKIDGALYGGSCEKGNVAGRVTINVTGGEIGSDSQNAGSIFGGGYGINTFIASGVNLNIDAKKDITIDGTIYGGSALGTVIDNISVTSKDDDDPSKIVVNSDFYCGSMGDKNEEGTGIIQGNCTLNIDGGTYKGNVFGENNSQGSPTGLVNVTVGGNYPTNINNLYGGGNEADSESQIVNVYIKDNSNITNTFGGGNKATVENTHVYLQGGNSTNIYGGSNESGDVISTNITVTGGSSTNIYGGNNLGGSTNVTNILVNNGNITNIYGGGNEAVAKDSTINIEGGTITNLFGGGNKALIDNSVVNLKNGTVTNTYGGGNEAGVTNSTNINLLGSTCTLIYGGSNKSGDVKESHIIGTSGTADTIYGGNNIGGKTTDSNIEISNITVNNIYGGGKNADTTKTNILINSGNITNIYGGGESASIDTDTNINVLDGTITNIYGGSNKDGLVNESNVTIEGGIITTIYGGNNAGGKTSVTNVKIENGTITDIYGGGSKADSDTTNVILNNSTNEISNIFGGCKEASATKTNVTLNNGKCNKVFGGSNTSGTILDSSIIINDGTYKIIYGGNNDGGKTEKTLINSEGGSVNIIFGGGNNAETGSTKVIINGTVINDSVYGGGNNAKVKNTDVLVQNKATITNHLYGGGNNGEVDENTLVNIDNSYVIGNVFAGGNNALVHGNTSVNVINSSTVGSNLYGGGNNGRVMGSTFVDIKNSTISKSAYAGGNGETAVVAKDTNITVEGESRIGNHVFGGGNAAQTGNSASDNSHGLVNITGAIINGNVYGGANTSVLYGETVVNIGFDAVSNYNNSTDYIKGDISIGGTVFGGGEANASGSEVYDFDFISVTKGIIINIDGNNHNTFNIAGSIFGSGNASRTTGYSRVYINNYGTEGNIKNNVSLQRADLAVLNNSHIALSGATDRTNEYSQVVFSLSRITELDLKNNSEIYLENGANLLNKFRSLNSDDTLATVNIDENTHLVTRSTNNRLYILEDKVLNIALNQNVTAYGEVDGMTFFGMFKRDRNGNIVNAMYNTSYKTGDTPLEGEMYYFDSGSYVLGKHETNHNIKVDGFYTNYDNPDNPGKILVDYITPSPEDAEHYMWTIGVSVQSYDIEIIASKYSTLGTYEFPFINNTNGNTTFSIVGFNYDNLNPDVSLVNPDNIPRIASSGEIADNTFGLAIKPGIGWISVGETYFLTDSSSLYGGITNYKTENSNITPSFLFYLYHSKNLQTEGLVGNVTISVLTVTPIDDLTNSVERINFNITITRAIFDSNDYEGAMTPGRQYEMFTSSKMDITAKSSLSAYYSLFTESERSIYHNGYHRVLTSNVILPVNTKITMIDFASATKPEYYYYIVNEEDNLMLQNDYEAHGEVEYKFSNFIRMGSLDETNKYNDELANSIYYDEDSGIAIEEFIFIVDFKNANITDDMLNCSLLIELMDSDNNILHSVLGIQRGNLVYNLHTDYTSVIDVDAKVSKEMVYVGDIEDLKVTINFNQNSEATTRIIDTTYYDQKLGLKISFYDERNNQINGVDLMGISLSLDGNNYYARSDGTIRFKIADKVANSYSNIKINTANSSLSSGDYKVKVEAFYSVDGIYFGIDPADSDEVTFKMMSRTYGLNVDIPYDELVINKDGGKNVLGNNKLNLKVNYSGGLINPNLKVALYRRTYNDIYDTTYNIVDIKNYINNELTLFGNNIYNLLDSINEENTYIFDIKNEVLKTGTYKLEIRLYDGDLYVGDVIKYIIIK